MKRMIFQVSVGPNKTSQLYKYCMNTVAFYCARHGIDHQVLTEPRLKIKPNPFTTNRSANAQRLGYLPIFEKENAFDIMRSEGYDQIAIIDADIYIREDAPNIFDEFGTEHDFGAVPEMDMPINAAYMQKIKNYSHMQYNTLAGKASEWRYETSTGYEFMNMGMIVFNRSLLPYLDGRSAKDFLEQTRFQAFVDGAGNWKWSTDQTLLNYWIRKDGINFKRMDWKWNGLYSALQKDKIKEAHFVHFFLKDKLPNAGENVDELMTKI